MRTVYLDGQFIPESEAKLSIYDLSVMQAAAAFEMTRSFGGKHFKLDEHLTRLWHSCRLLGIEYGKYDESLFRVQLRELCHQVTLQNDHGPGEEHRLLIVASPGCAPMYKDLEGVIPHPFVYIADFPLSLTTRGMGRQFTDGATAKCAYTQVIPDQCIPPTAKHRGRLAFHLAQQEVASKADWAIMLDQWRNFVECPGANILAIIRGKLHAPNFGALQGISRAYAIEILESLGVQLAPNPDIKPEMALSGEIREMFVTGTPFCAVPIVSVDGFRIGNGKPGPIYENLMQAWSKNVGLDIPSQIIRWDAHAKIH